MWHSQQQRKFLLVRLRLMVCVVHPDTMPQQMCSVGFAISITQRSLLIMLPRRRVPKSLCLMSTITMAMAHSKFSMSATMCSLFLYMVIPSGPTPGSSVMKMKLVPAKVAATTSTWHSGRKPKTTSMCRDLLECVNRSPLLGRQW